MSFFLEVSVFQGCWKNRSDSTCHSRISQRVVNSGYGVYYGVCQRYVKGCLMGELVVSHLDAHESTSFRSLSMDTVGYYSMFEVY